MLFKCRPIQGPKAKDLLTVLYFIKQVAREHACLPGHKFKGLMMFQSSLRQKVLFPSTLSLGLRSEGR